jgi:hypothetical protein
LPNIQTIIALQSTQILLLGLKHRLEDYWGIHEHLANLHIFQLININYALISIIYAWWTIWWPLWSTIQTTIALQRNQMLLQGLKHRIENHWGFHAYLANLHIFQPN